MESDGMEHLVDDKSDGMEHLVDDDKGDGVEHVVHDKSDTMEHADDDDSDDSSSDSGDDDLQEDQGKGNDVSHMEEATMFKNKAELSKEEVLKMVFDTHEKAYDFYVSYAKCVGFSVRKGDVARDDDGKLIRRRFVCNRQGLRDKKHYMRIDRKRDQKPETRTNCHAMLSIYLDNHTSTWRVRTFEKGHNHELAPAGFDYIVPNTRRLTTAKKAQSDGIRIHGFLTFQIMGFMVGQARAFAGVEFSKDLYSYIDKQRCPKIVDGDALAAISYLQGKADSDPTLFARYTTTDDDQLGNLFWADGLSQVDYEYFGDVVGLDTKYKESMYHRRLVIFSGTNHHRQTCIFACALLGDERADTYKWALENFLDAMEKKHPSAVVTDDNEAMREAIQVVFPNATHRLCAWHLQKGAAYNIRDTEFVEAFKKSIYTNFDPDEFEEYWRNMIQKFEVYDSMWVEETYKKKEMWATTYLRDKFCSGLRASSRCEGLNPLMKKYIKARHNILELVQHFELALKEFRNNELVAEFNSMYNEPVLTTALESIERKAAKVFTREIFKEVQKELEGAALLFVVGCENLSTTATFKLSKYGKPGWEYKVTYDRESQKFECQCCLWSTHGIPCSHIFCVMIYEHIAELPEKMILKRWTQAAKSFNELPDEEDEVNDKKFLFRYGALCAASNWMSFLAARKLHNFLETKDEIYKITAKLEHKGCMVDTRSFSIPKNTMDDTTKGASLTYKNGKKRRRCKACNKMGHSKSSCPRVKDRRSRGDDLSSSSMSDNPRNAGHATNSAVDPPNTGPATHNTLDDPPNAGPATNNEVGHPPTDSSTAMTQSLAVNHAAAASRFGVWGPQFLLPGPGQPCFAANIGHQYYLANQGARYYPLAPAQQQFLRPQGLVQRFVPQGVLPQQYVGGPNPQFQGLAQQKRGKGRARR
ncbi:protein FAR1-RELATED SEQUENCE 5 [Arachis hypogaea]|uniref:protein FAR1-RELATED SEQUENCE 5 n=1 Tax=Arachis hypogaea TaxID=3818 RepID=UPI000DEC1792|nr:protein FAR1-RELATED SEQUENCE 5 [Arachis hypogaea]XP_029151959.1 protein FAR1-RELATED SEQUENCE 5 [Arachis hypogaea]QHO56236.1 Protein FAR1-RELATED SEQUENCE [Arachis hypogaea]QHO56237.1 Protein FAR1-RELATED SEQUENCE [Arachis hypogaea]